MRQLHCEKRYGERRTVLAVPCGCGHICVLEPSSLDAVYEDTPHAELAHHFIQGGLAYEELFRRVCYDIALL